MRNIGTAGLPQKGKPSAATAGLPEKILERPGSHFQERQQKGLRKIRGHDFRIRLRVARRSHQQR